MPRAVRTKGRRHDVAAPLPTQRSFAVPDSQVSETILPGSDVTATLGDSQVPGPSTRAKPFHAAPSVSHPYAVSKSHLRREKRKARSQVGGGLTQVASALSEAMGLPPPDEAKQEARNAKERWEEKQRMKAEQKDREEAGKMGAGKGKSMSEKKRRNQIALEAQRIPAIVNHTAFKADPWSTIRLHAANSLAMVDK